MSIMEKMRGSTDSTPMQIVLILIVVAFIGWYALPQGEQVRVALEVDGQRILMAEYGPRFQQARAIAQMGGRDLTEAQERQLANDLKQQIARDVVLAREAKRLGYQVSPEELSRMIRTDPTYQDRTGKFDKALWNDAIKSSGRSRSDFEELLRRELLRDKLRAAVTLGVELDEGAARAEFEEVASTIDLEYVRIDPESYAQAFPPDPADIATWAAENESALQATYDRLLPSRFDLPDTVELAVIRLRKADTDADAIQERIRGLREQLLSGADFGSLARRWSEDVGTVEAGGAMGERRVSALSSQVRDLIADLPDGGVSEILDEMDRVSIFKVVARQEGRVIPFDEVRDELAREQYLAEQVQARAQAIADGWADLPPVELLTELGATLDTLRDIAPAEYFPGIGNPPPELIERLGGAELGAVHGPVAGRGERPDWFVARLTNRPEPDEEMWEVFRGRKLREARFIAFERYADDLQTRARINTGEGEVTQGGWQDWLSGILPGGE